MSVASGLEVFLRRPPASMRGQRVGLICNPASVDRQLRHAADLLWESPQIRLSALFGPQHGARGETQDNMIEWESYRDPETSLPVFSLYGETRKPTPEMLDQVDALIFDVQDVGARYYTFIYTMALAMQACAENGKRFVVLDRPNPVGGQAVEGNLVRPECRSFVGLYSLPARHGMTVGELARLFNREYALGCRLEVVEMEGYQRSMSWGQTGLPWVMPSPNMPTPDTAWVYPGLCLLEGSNVSEGRGTTRPFEISGAPWVNPKQLASRLQGFELPGAALRPLWFIPTFHKWAGKMVGGVQIHVQDWRAFRPFRTGLALLRAYRELAPDEFAWKEPPYEYEYEKLPIDILLGDADLRRMIEQGRPLEEMEASFAQPLEQFKRIRHKYLLYPDQPSPGESR
ncbi:MAG TPA: DUF1343 domain-containing protein [Acidobacteriota bacterium]|nr:DUF1343 domain-containing protein [Acidobacteriota bacterium]